VGTKEVWLVRIALVLFGGLVVLTQGTTVAPPIYTPF